VVWVDSELYERIKDLFSPDQKVATEKDVASVEDLINYMKKT